MENVSPYCVVLTTYADENVGKAMITSLLEKRLAACIQVQSIDSYYHWQGEVACDQEKLVIIKTTCDAYQAVEADILANHNYDTPQIVQLPITAGYQDYLTWIGTECNGA